VITAVDTNVLLDVFSADPTHGPASREALESGLERGTLVVSDVVWAETAAAFPARDAAEAALDTVGVEFAATGREAAGTAAQAWRVYRSAGGPRTRVVADFLIGAHAVVQADRLLTRDRGFYRRYFTGLEIVDPSGARR
jgi:hypothetical protein